MHRLLHTPRLRSYSPICALQRCAGTLSAFAIGLLLVSCGDPVEDGASFSSVENGEAIPSPVNVEGAAPATRIPVDGANQKRIVVLAADLQQPFRAVQANLMAAAVDSSVFSIEFSDAVGDPQLQIAQIREAIATRPAAIAIFPFRAADLIAPLQEAADAGIAVAILGKPPEGAPYTASIYTDQLAVGRIAGEFVLQRLKVKMQSEGETEVNATAFEITGTDLADDRTRLRSEGFNGVFEDHPGFELLHQAPGMWNERDAASAMAEASHIQGRADIIFCHSDAMAHGAYLAGRKIGNHLNSLFMGIDGVGGPRGGIAKVRDQMLAGTVSVPLQGEEIAELLMSIARGDAPSQKDQMIEPELVTIANSASMYEKHSAIGTSVQELPE